MIANGQKLKQRQKSNPPVITTQKKFTPTKSACKFSFSEKEMKHVYFVFQRNEMEIEEEVEKCMGVTSRTCCTVGRSAAAGRRRWRRPSWSAPRTPCAAGGSRGRTWTGRRRTPPPSTPAPPPAAPAPPAPASPPPPRKTTTTPAAAAVAPPPPEQPTQQTPSSSSSSSSARRAWGQARRLLLRHRHRHRSGRPPCRGPRKASWRPNPWRKKDRATKRKYYHEISCYPLDLAAADASICSWAELLRSYSSSWSSAPRLTTKRSVDWKQKLTDDREEKEKRSQQQQLHAIKSPRTGEANHLSSPLFSQQLQFNARRRWMDGWR